MNITVNIRELRVRGFANTNRAALGRAVSDSLQGLIARRGVPARLQHLGTPERLDGGRFQYRQQPRADTLGEHIAERIYSTLSQQ